MLSRTSSIFITPLCYLDFVRCLRAVCVENELSIGATVSEGQRVSSAYLDLNRKKFPYSASSLVLVYRPYNIEGSLFIRFFFFACYLTRKRRDENGDPSQFSCLLVKMHTLILKAYYCLNSWKTNRHFRHFSASDLYYAHQKTELRFQTKTNFMRADENEMMMK